MNRFLPLPEFRDRVDGLIDDVHASALAPGIDRIYVPGEIEAERRVERLRDGIPFSRIEKVKAAGGDPDDLARRGSRIFLAMIFRDGFFHADPHPGNRAVALEHEGRS